MFRIKPSTESTGSIDTLPLGIEFYPESSKLVKKLFNKGLINHTQVSLPAGWNPLALRLLPRNIPLYIHSTFLNVLGSNDWKTLEKAANQIKKLRPLAVIEHFGLFIDKDGRKHGVNYLPNREKLAISNLKRWRNLLGCPVFIENIPVSQKVKQYYEDFQRVSTLASTPHAIDLPHLLISFNVTHLSYEDICETLEELKPEQVHVGGLLLSQERIEDNHKTISPWFFHLIRRSNIQPRLITLEQSNQLPNNYIETHVKLIQKNQWGNPPDLQGYKKTRTPRDFSEDLAEERARGFNIEKASRVRNRTSLRSDFLKLSESYYPFLYPIASLRKNSEKMNAEDVVETLAQILQTYRNFSSWYLGKECKNQIYIRISHGGTHQYLDFLAESNINKAPPNAWEECVLKTRDKSEVSLFVRGG